MCARSIQIISGLLNKINKFENELHDDVEYNHELGDVIETTDLRVLITNEPRKIKILLYIDVGLVCVFMFK